ncbi:unnamed protein product [Mytilus coruscus]|uniref:Reverse transcriptase zinc-binding domain-containing protein n=1 Tax=Mytilus coruscus TaxID=42192 RepID=A0A6J8AER6_MYTCO|nr:unnamed protein product [Mytilus coruscus]
MYETTGAGYKICKVNMIANVDENIKKARRSAYSLLGGGFHGHNGLDKKFLKQILSLPTCVADITVNILTGILPIEAQVHIRALGLFNKICNQPDDSVEKSLAKRQLIIKNDESSSWFIAIKHMLRKYDLQEASWYLNNPVKKTVWTSTIKKTIYNHWNRSIVQLQSLYKGLNFLTTENLRTGNIHPLFKINCHSIIDTARLPVKLKLLTGSYILQSKRIRMYKDETDPKCLLCAKEEENIEHFILKCESLRILRNALLQEITTTLNAMGIQFDELSTNENLQHILDLTPIAKAKKLSPVSVVQIERLTRRLLYQLHIARYKMLYGQ